MKITLTDYHGGSRVAKPPFPEADYAVAAGTCPHCQASPFKVAGHGKRIAKDDRAYEADATALCCGKPVGVLRAEVKTLFGLREDEAVMCGPWRVVW